MANRCYVHNRVLPCLECSAQNHIGRLPHDERVFPSAIFAAIVDERQFQDQKYGPITGKGGHELGAWLIIAESELAEAKKALVHGGSKEVKGRDTIRAELVQLAAVCVAALEQHGLTEGPIATLFYKDGMPE